MSITDIQSGYWQTAPQETWKGSPCAAANKISKTAWMDLYYDLFMQTHGEDQTTQALVIADAKARLSILKANGIRR